MTLACLALPLDALWMASPRARASILPGTYGQSHSLPAIQSPFRTIYSILFYSILIIAITLFYSILIIAITLYTKTISIITYNYYNDYFSTLISKIS